MSVAGKKSAKVKVSRHKIIVTFILCLLLVTMAIWSGENVLIITDYGISTPKLDTSIKFVLISDLHNKEFGKNNEKLVEKIAEQKPDFITIVGDMNTKTSLDYSVTITLLKQLVEISPIYYAPGNHESAIIKKTNIIDDIKSTGTVYLSNKGTYFEKNGERIYIGGLRKYPYYEYDYPDFKNADRYFFDSFREIQKEYFSILLCHQPECYMWSFKEYNIDLMLSGHTHGGLIRIPFLGGVVAPNQKLFPKYDKGEFFSGTARMIITSGLGDTHFIPRINNPPEICVIKINPSYFFEKK